MKFTIDKDIFFNQINTVQKFTSDRLNTSAALQGVYIHIEKKKIHFYATDLNTYCHTSSDLSADESIDLIIEPKKILEFVQFLQQGDINITIESNSIVIQQEKTKGAFPVIVAEDFPLPPVLKEEAQDVKPEFLLNNLPFLLFTASSDDARPVLTGINFVASEEDLTLVATDGFRLSLVKEKRKGTFSSMIIPADFLKEVIRYVRDAKTVSFTYSEKEHLVLFKVGETEFYSRLIDGEFPPYERVIPEEKKATAVLKKEDLLRNTKLISIFAREYSNVIIYDFSKDGLVLSPKKEANADNTTTQDISFDGDQIRVAFNYKYVVDFLNHIDAEEIEVELLRSDAPVVFKIPKNNSFIHIIMPVRIQEG
ncbi:DNA polymerase III subunit beta [Candidatus Roizmanbacteria bacterium]|nr:MAG: DNA polymerase III subunit beta [Candidatus Roizmanbacteria bacterium]